MAISPNRLTASSESAVSFHAVLIMPDPGSRVKPKLTKVACWAHARLPVGVGRGLFVGSDKGGRTAAIRTSFMITCRRLQTSLFAYLRDVPDRIGARPVNRLEEPLPDDGKAAQNHTQNIPA
jgi:hypothetical protein